VKRLAESLAPQQWKTLSWREGTKKSLRSRFAALQVRPAHRDERRKEPHAAICCAGDGAASKSILKQPSSIPVQTAYPEDCEVILLLPPIAVASRRGSLASYQSCNRQNCTGRFASSMFCEFIQIELLSANNSRRQFSR
jgi:hypothetical protein